MTGRLLAALAVAATLAGCGGTAPPARTFTDVQMVRPPLPAPLLAPCVMPPRPAVPALQSDVAGDAIAPLTDALLACAARHDALAKLLRDEGVAP